jgi:nucleoside-diphosphate-sugar epimerase
VSDPIHENLPYTAITRKGRIRAQMAEAALAAHRSGKVRVSIGRGSDFYGPGVLGSTLGERTFIPLLRGKSAELLGNPDLPHTYTYIENFGKALAILGEQEDALGQVWHVPNAETLTSRQVIGLAFEEAGLSPKVNRMGRFMMTLGGLFIPEAHETVEMLYEFEKPFVVDSSKFERTFGMKATHYPVGLRNTLAWYRKYIRLES